MARLVRSIGLLASAAGLAFVIRILVTEWPEVGPSVRSAEPRWLVLAFVLGAVGMTFAASGWGLVLRLLGWPMGFGRAIALYFRGEIAKYVPGGMWAVVGRGELARRDGAPATIAYSSVLLSLGALYLSCAVVAGALVPWSDTLERGPAAAVVAVVVLGLVGLHPRVLRVVRSIAGRLLRRELEVDVPSWRASLALVVFYAPVWLCVGTATWSIVRALDVDASWAAVVLATATSWLVGFLAVPIPGGIGIREAVFLAALPSLDLGPASAAAVVARVLFMLVDALGAALGWLVRSSRARMDEQRVTKATNLL
jgi:uncharacterized membrane protein YbhN (UPF0104 family)